MSRMSSSLPICIGKREDCVTCSQHHESCCHEQRASSNANDGSNSSICSTKSSVTFGTACVREYERVLEGRPEVPMALNLGWEYVEQAPISVDDFDRICRQDRIYSSSASSLQASQKSLQQRFAILHHIHGFSVQELQDAETLRLRQFQPEEDHSKKRGKMFRKLFGRKRDKNSICHDNSNNNDKDADR
jgi:hypothetical protein